MLGSFVSKKIKGTNKELHQLHKAILQGSKNGRRVQEVIEVTNTEIT